MRFVLALMLALSTVACGDETIINLPNNPTPVEPESTRIEFRVSGNASSVRVRFSSERDGLIQTTTTLPFFTSFNTEATNLFLNLEVTPISYSVIQLPFLSAQIFADGNLFREATSNEFILNTLTVNGTWRK